MQLLCFWGGYEQKKVGFFSSPVELITNTEGITCPLPKISSLPLVLLMPPPHEAGTDSLALCEVL